MSMGSLPPLGAGAELPPAPSQGVGEEPSAVPSMKKVEVGSIGNIEVEEAAVNAILPSPGKYSDLTRDSNEVLFIPEMFDGLRLDLNKGATPTFSVSHSANVGSQREPDQYMFASTYVDPNLTVFGRLFPDFSVQCQIMATLSERWKMTLGGLAGFPAKDPQMQIPSNMSGELDYTGDGWTSQLRWQSPGEVTMAYTRQLTPKLSVGTNFLFTRAQLKAVHAATAKWATQRWVATCSFSNAYLDGQTLALAYTHNASEKVQLATEWSIQRDGQSPIGWQSRWSTGFNFRLSRAKARANIDNAGRIQGYLDHDLSPHTTLSLCADLDHGDGKHKFGVGLTVNV